MSPGFHRLMGAQGLAGLADNALLLVVIAMLIEQSKAAHWIPLLKLGFTLSYVVLGPWVGRLADAWHKPRVMQWANALKWMAVLSILLGLDVMLAYVWVGLGAAIYSPAKYGWITEVEPPQRLVHANAWIEVSTVSAAVFGVALGDTVLLMILAASASYIAVPAVLRHAMPEVNPALYMGTSLGITFPLNIIVGIPAYIWLASYFVK